MMKLFKISGNRAAIIMLALCSLCLVPNRARANDFLEKQKHYSVYSAGMDHIHFKVPVWAYGKGYNYYLDDASRIYFVKDGVEHTIANVHSNRYDENEKDSDKGTAYVRLEPGMGSISVSSMADGVPYFVKDNGEWSPQLIVIQKEEDDCPHATILEFDWYYPSSMFGAGQITIKIYVNIHRSLTGNSAYEYDWNFGQFNPGSSLTTPQLFTPYLYALNENGVTGYGNAGIPYALFYDPKSYTTSLSPDTEVPLSRTERSGSIYIMTTDTVIEQMTANFDVVYNNAGDVTTQTSTAVDIPPYHRVYNFTAIEEIDETGTYTGNNRIEWKIKNPMLRDLVDGDYFELQRAMKSDYSDAQTLNVIQMIRNQDGKYSYVDNSREIWTGNAAIQRDTMSASNKVGVTAKDYTLRDANGKSLCKLDVDYYTNILLQPSVPVYYRIRRASSAVWGWEGHDFAQKTTLNKHNFLAPLATTQENYTLDADYKNNRKVHFNLKLENAEVTYNVPSDEDFNLTYAKSKSNVLANITEGNVRLTIDSKFPKSSVAITDYDNGNIIAQEESLDIETKTYNIPSGSCVSVTYPYYRSGSLIYQWRTNVYNVTTNSTITITSKSYQSGYQGICEFQSEEPTDEEIETAFRLVESHLRDSLHAVASALILDTKENLGRCMWDKSAKLVLMRTTVETDQTLEIIVPNDSIKRQDDGSWVAHITDVAGSACTHYRYAVRIDESGSDLRLSNPDAQQKPITINGPELYYDEGATITEFQATKGLTTDYLKNGVMLNWVASSSNVDEYQLLRLEKNSDRVPDTIYTGTENTFFDRSAVPDVHYNYTVTAIYQCNNKRTSNSATTEGWRTPYGEIRGAIIMSDNSGISGVNVALQDETGSNIRTAVTSSDGSFRFDSLLYNYNTTSGSKFVVVPTAQYGTFGYNYTTSPTATISITKENPLATEINFINTDVVRMTGRVLYKGSTIPVAGAMFLLNGDTIRRGSSPLSTGIDGTFELILTKQQPYRLQVFKKGHTFEGDGILRVEGDNEQFALTKALDGVRFYDMTKVRLVGRVAGGNDQKETPEGFGIGKNNLGDNLKLVVQLEGDNTAQIVYDPDDLTRDTMVQKIGKSSTLFEKKRITISPDPLTGEYAADLFPVKYKVIQATANGYATLFGAGQGSETFDLTNAPRDTFNAVYSAEKDSVLIDFSQDGVIKYSKAMAVSAVKGTLRDGDNVMYNAVYDRIYHNPVQLSMTQLIYGMEKDGLGEPEMQVSTMTGDGENIPLYYSTTLSNGVKDVTYLFNYPLFINNRSYQFSVAAYEDYFYNNDPLAGKRDRVPLRGGNVRVHNGLVDKTTIIPVSLNSQGKGNVTLPVDNINVTYIGDMALSTVTAALDVEGNVIETSVFRGYITGDEVMPGTLHDTEADVALLDVVRNPGGTGSSSWIESGSTYHYSYKESYKWEAGVKLNLKYGLDVSADIGVIFGNPGNYTGSTYSTSRQLTLPLPFTHKWDWGYQYDYTFTTSERISTATAGSIYTYGGLVDASGGMGYGVGGMADVFVGSTISMLSGKAKSITIINDSVYQLKQPAFKAGSMRVVARGEDDEGKPYYLVIGEKVVLGSRMANTFVYSQYYILNTLIPRLAIERQNLLMQFPNEESAQSLADELGTPVYWLMDTLGRISLQDTLNSSYYKMIIPSESTEYFNDEVAALDHMLSQWSDIIVQNEKTKVCARLMGKHEGTYAVSFGNVYSHTDNYSAAIGENYVPHGGTASAEGANSGYQVATSLAGSIPDIYKYLATLSDQKFGMTAAEALKDYYNTILVRDEDGNEHTERANQPKPEQELGAKDNKSKLTYTLTPILNYSADLRHTNDMTMRKSCGYTLVPDAYGDIVVSVYRVPMDKVWGDTTYSIRSRLGVTRDSMMYSSYVFFTEGGSTFCPYEGEMRTVFYNPGTVISNATVPIAVPELTANTYEVAHVQADQPAYLRIEMKNNGQLNDGRLSDYNTFNLGMVNASNSDGLEVYADGNSLAAPIPINIYPGQSAIKTIKIVRGTVDDYNDLKLRLSVASCPKNYSDISFSVHFMPESSPVAIASPQQNWVMNTLSPQDSAGYYLPVEINGFNLNMKNFDHIELQYKLSSQSEDMWVNLCSFYDSDSLYEAATGNKAMIENGRIKPFRFYGEKDPVEQKYDLRAVSYCRYGSGFVSKSSTVIKGVKDTRPPRVFGEPEPINAILGVGDNLKLRFNEPIAGNYLDEDNNFQIKGVTNGTGITANTSLHFDGSPNSYAISQVNRSMRNNSFTIDMLVKPTNPNEKAVFFTHSDGEETLEFGMTGDRKLYLDIDGEVLHSKTLEPMLEFTRVIAAYDYDEDMVTFYAGTRDVTDPMDCYFIDEVDWDLSAPLCIGKGFNGNILETRLWLKALTQEEIATTHLHYLTGYERQLVAYYRMDEGSGNTAKDLANGANLDIIGATWSMPGNISIALTKNDSVALAQNLLSRSMVYDATYMLWFRNTNGDGTIFRAGDKKFALTDGMLQWQADSTNHNLGSINTGEWHHLVLTVNRTYNNVAIYLDGKMVETYDATQLSDIAGDMYFGGGGYEGNIDEFVVFEQALPKSLVEEYDNRSPLGDEMGLMAYLPFEEQKQNPNGILELVFSVNDRRIFKDPNGNIVNKVVPLVTKYEQSLADKSNYAPVIGYGLLTKLKFDWAFNNDELLINLNVLDREINKQSVYVTVRDVEDLNGNPMPSPVMWPAYVDRNNLKWGERELNLYALYGADNSKADNIDMKIINNSGKRHTYTIESLPEWLKVNNSYGSLQPIEEKNITFSYNAELPVGTYFDLIYLTDENGLSEPLRVTLTIEAECPWEDDEIDYSMYDNTMSIRARVYMTNADQTSGQYDTSNDDVIAVFCDGKLVGKASNTFLTETGQSYVYLTVYGNAGMVGHVLSFKLWRASSGKIFNLTPSVTQRYQNNAMCGISPEQPLLLTASSGSSQQITLQQGWNWISWNIYPTYSTPDRILTAEQGFKNGDIVKSPSDRMFSQFILNDTANLWAGTLKSMNYQRMYLLRTSQPLKFSIEGRALTKEQRTITLYHGWNSISYLLDEPLSLRDALADYYDNATVGDMVKSKTQFAVFTENNRWEGSLQTMRPGAGYLFRRLDANTVTMAYIPPTANNKAPKYISRDDSEQDINYAGNSGVGEFVRPEASSNMTLIAKISQTPRLNENECRDATLSGLQQSPTSLVETFDDISLRRNEMPVVNVYVGQELAAVAQPQIVEGDTLYFITVQADDADNLHFETGNGIPLYVDGAQMVYESDAHHGTLHAPVLLVPDGEPTERVYKIIEDDRVLIIRNGKRYDVVGRKQ